MENQMTGVYLLEREISLLKLIIAGSKRPKDTKGIDETANCSFLSRSSVQSLRLVECRCGLDDFVQMFPVHRLIGELTNVRTYVTPFGKVHAKRFRYTALWPFSGNEPCSLDCLEIAF